MTALEVASRNVEVFNQHDLTAFASLYATNAVAYDPQYSENLLGRDAIRQDAADFILAFPDVHATIISAVSSADSVAFEMEMRATHLGPMVTPSGNLPATNRPLTMRVGRFIRIDAQGAILEDNRYYDTAGIAQQLGLG